MSILSNDLKMAENKRDNLNKEFSNMISSLSSLQFIMGMTADSKELAVYKIQYDDLLADKDNLSKRLSLAEREVYNIRAKKAPLRQRNLTNELKSAEIQFDEVNREFRSMINSLSSLEFIRNNANTPAEERDCNLQYYVLFAQKDDLEKRLSLAEDLVTEIRREIRASGRKCN